MAHDDFHALTRYQSWGRETLSLTGLPKKFEGKVTLELAFRQGELMDSFSIEVKQRIISRLADVREKSFT